QGIDSEGEVYSILDPQYDNAKVVGEILHKKPGAITSQFDLGYATTLNLVKLLGDQVGTAVEKSFSAFQRKSPRHALENLEAVLQVLRERHYLDRSGLTGKGRFCAKLAGFEVHLTELFWEGCFEDLDTTQTALLCAAIIYETRSRGGQNRPVIEDNSIPGRIMNRARKRVREFRRSEDEVDRPSLLKELDFGLSFPLRSWMLGGSFEEVRRAADMQDGDLVRSFRLTVQVLRQLSWALPQDHHLTDACRTAIQLINRDEVDAEKQLRTT
ncbi:MAG: hypothetical protein KDB53_12875, partial [Planctomycetes bacterium]|nr:hypothetical protein [Planctomycetota bacterium]